MIEHAASSQGAYGPIGSKLAYAGVAAAEFAGGVLLNGWQSVATMTGYAAMGAFKQRLVRGAPSPSRMAYEWRALGQGDQKDAQAILASRVQSGIAAPVTSYCGAALWNLAAPLYQLSPSGFFGGLYRAGLNATALGSVSTLEFAGEQLKPKRDKDEKSSAQKQAKEIKWSAACWQAGLGAAVAAVSGGVGWLIGATGDGGMTTAPGDDLLKPMARLQANGIAADIGTTSVYLLDKATSKIQEGLFQREECLGAVATPWKGLGTSYIEDLPPPRNWSDTIAQASFVVSKLGTLSAVAMLPGTSLAMFLAVGVMQEVGSDSRTGPEDVIRRMRVFDLETEVMKAKRAWDSCKAQVMTAANDLQKVDSPKGRESAEARLKLAEESCQKAQKKYEGLQNEIDECRKQNRRYFAHRSKTSWESDWQLLQGEHVNGLGAIAGFGLDLLRNVYMPTHAAMSLGRSLYQLGKRAVTSLGGVAGRPWDTHSDEVAGAFTDTLVPLVVNAGSLHNNLRTSIAQALGDWSLFDHIKAFSQPPSVEEVVCVDWEKNLRFYGGLQEAPSGGNPRLLDHRTWRYPSQLQWLAGRRADAGKANTETVLQDLESILNQNDALPSTCKLLPGSKV